MTSKPPIGFHGKTGTGALIGLSAVGQQEPFLYCKKKNLPTDYKHVEYTEGNVFYKVYRPVQDRYLGSEVRHIFRPKEMGDLLTGLIISFELPSAVEYNVQGLFNHGYSIFEYAKLLMNGEEIQSMDGDFMSNYESMYSNEADRSNTLSMMVNMNYPYDTFPVYPRGNKKQKMLIPIPFFFNNHYTDSNINTSTFRSPLPLCALYNTELTLVIKFKALSDIVTNPSGLNGTEITDLKFITEETVISGDERNALRSREIRFPIEKIIKEDFEYVYREEIAPKKYLYRYYFRYYFNSLYTARAIMFYFKEKKTGYNPEYYVPLTNATLNTLKITDRGEARDKLYYQQYQSYTHGYHCNGFFYMISFSERPLQVILGDYEFRAPKPQSAYIDINMYPDSPDSYVFWTDNFLDPLAQSDYVIDKNIILNTSVGLGTDGFLNSIRAINGGFFRMDSVVAGIPNEPYTATLNTILPYTFRFNPWDYTYTRVGVDYKSVDIPYPTYVDEATGTLKKIDASFTYSGSVIANPIWSTTSNTQALVTIKTVSGDPKWGLYTGNIYTITDGSPITVAPIDNSWSPGYYYPSDIGSIEYNGFIKINDLSRVNVNTSVKTVDIYQLSFYYFSTVELVLNEGKGTVIT